MEGPYKTFIAEGTYNRHTTPIKSKANKSSTSNVAIEKIRHAKMGDLDMTGSEVRQFYEEVVLSTEAASDAEAVSGPNTLSVSSNVKSDEQTPSESKKTFTSLELIKAILSNNINLVLEIASQSPEIINDTDNFGWTGLMMAACEGFLEICFILIEFGADTNIKDTKGNTAENLAEIKGHKHLVQLIQSAATIEISSDEDDDDAPEPFDCDVCNEKIKESTRKKHEASTLHQFNMKITDKEAQIAGFGIPVHNKGYQLMLKQGWDKNKGLGPKKSGRLYPIKTVLRTKRQGLGMKQKSPKVSHFGPNDLAAVQYRKTPKAKTRRDMQRDKLRNQRVERTLRQELS